MVNFHIQPNSSFECVASNTSILLQHQKSLECVLSRRSFSFILKNVRYSAKKIAARPKSCKNRLFGLIIRIFGPILKTKTFRHIC